MKKVIIIGILCVVLLSACMSQNIPEGYYDDDLITTKKIREYYGDDLTIYTKCSDHVVCYYHSPNGPGGGMSCFYNESELLNKYCEEK